MTDKEKIERMTQIIQDTLWMARRYANGRKTYAPQTVNDAVAKMPALGICIFDDQCLIEDGNSSAHMLDI